MRMIPDSLKAATWLRTWHLLLAGLWLLACPAPAQTTLRKDLKKDFGAVGDGKTNDHAAFEKAADFFNQRAKTPAGSAPAVLTIPKGVYLVGRQSPPANKGADVLRLAGCRNLTIQGADSASTEIRYASGLRYGAFDPATQRPFEAPTAYFVDGSYAAIAGICIVLQNCENVTITGLAINGNVGRAVVGGHWGDTGIQLNYDGIFVGDSRRITLRGLALHHLGRDGIQVLNHLAKSLDDAQADDILLENLTCNYNGRQGLSVTGVSGLRAVNCSFSHTGRVVIPALGKALLSNPGAGVDLEPENGFVKNVRFDNCRLVDNAGQALVSDRPTGDHPETTKNVVIANSLLWGTTNWSVWVTQPGFLFSNCRIYGAPVHGCQAKTPAQATRFVGCTFEDKVYHGQRAYGPFLLHSDSFARGMSLVNCQFVGSQSYLVHAIPAQLDSASLFHVRGCSFIYDYTQAPQGSYDKLLGVVFSGTTVFRNGPHRTSAHRSDMMLGSPAALASTVVRAPGSLQLLAPNSYTLVQGGLDIGRQPTRSRDSAQVVVGAANTLVINEVPGKVAELYIGPTSRLVVKKGGSLEVLRHVKVTVAGQLIIEDGAYFFLDPQAQVTLVGKGRLRVAPKVIKTKHPTLYSTYY
jgi:hypothetical protein